MIGWEVDKIIHLYITPQKYYHQFFPSDMFCVLKELLMEMFLLRTHFNMFFYVDSILNSS